MRHNVGGNDRNVRIAVGIILLLIAIFAPHTMVTGWRIVLGLIGIVALATAASRYCPINAALGINTCETKAAEKK